MPSVLKKINNRVAVITLNRPEKFNAFNREMAFLLQLTLDECAADANVRAIYMTGAGKAFCAGQDLTELSGENAIGIDEILSEHYNPIVTRIRNLRKPVIAAVNGIAAGAGANIALCCDVVIAIDSASFIQAFSKIGLIPDSGGTYFLPRLVGFQKASALMMLGDTISATEAERMGMLYKVFQAGDFTNESLKIAETLGAMPTQALALIKQALNYSVNASFEDQLKKEDELQCKAAATSDYEEGVKAFLEKRSAIFTGK